MFLKHRACVSYGPSCFHMKEAVCHMRTFDARRISDFVNHKVIFVATFGIYIYIYIYIERERERESYMC